MGIVMDGVIVWNLGEMEGVVGFCRLEFLDLQGLF